MMTGYQGVMDDDWQRVMRLVTSYQGVNNPGQSDRHASNVSKDGERTVSARMILRNPAPQEIILRNPPHNPKKPTT